MDRYCYQLVRTATPAHASALNPRIAYVAHCFTSRSSTTLNDLLPPSSPTSCAAATPTARTMHSLPCGAFYKRQGGG